MAKKLWYAKLNRDEYYVEYTIPAETKEEAIKKLHEISGEWIKSVKEK